ncbi:MAG: histidinol dehydrogenase, partial [Oxalicibacterium faecigallinarum]
MSIQIRKFDSSHPDFPKQLSEVLAFEASEDEAIDRSAMQILEHIKREGDKAVLEYTKRFDHVEADSMAALEISQAELQAALDQLTPERRAALQVAADRVRIYHERQKNEIGSNGFTYTEADGTILGQKVTPLDRVGLYVPGGKAAYPSSVLMNAIPAKVAGVPEVIMVVPTPNGVKNELVLAAAAMSGVDRVFTIGGAQAVGALAYGTATIPQVDKIVGPGNAYVAAAKRRVF